MLKQIHKIFFAIPFDNMSKEVYSRIASKIKTHFESKKILLNTVFGKEQIHPSPEYSKYESFKTQNIELQDQIFKQISETDVFIADLTKANPNVYFELGFALELQKNILRVSASNTSTLGFDIQNYEAHFYKNENDLFEKIRKYLEMFFEIKNLEYNSKYYDLCKEYNNVIIPVQKTNNIVNYNIVQNLIIRDGKMRIIFKFLEEDTGENWFGVSFRSDTVNPFSGYLLHIRQKGVIAFAFPGSILGYEKELSKSIKKDEVIEMIIEFENDKMRVDIKNECVYSDFPPLEKQNVGFILVSTWRCQAEVIKMEVINRDTVYPYKTNK